VELRLALPLRGVGAGGFAAVARYLHEADRREELAIQLDQGMLDIGDDATITATTKGRAYLDDLFALHARVTGRTWESRPAAVGPLVALTGRLLEAARPSGGAAFATQNPPYEPPGAPDELVLFNRLSALRYHRADAHAAAWTGAGHSVASIRALDGPARRAIEAETNRLAAAPFAALDDDERTAFSSGLAALA